MITVPIAQDDDGRVFALTPSGVTHIGCMPLQPRGFIDYQPPEQETP